MSVIDFKRPRRGRGQPLGTPRGRLCVGFRTRDWNKVWYEPVAGALDANDNDAALEGEPELGLFRCGEGDPTAEEPTEGEVAWLPHFDVARMNSTSTKERRLQQKRYMHMAWTYCAATDQARVQALEARWTSPEHVQWRHWASWFKIATDWRRRQRRRSATAQELRNFRAGVAGIPPEERDITSEDSDEGYYGGGDDDGNDGGGGGGGAPRGSMGPPPRPSSGGAATSSNGRRRPGGSRVTSAGSITRPSRQGTAGSRRSGGNLFVSGGARDRSISSGRTEASGSINGEGEDNDDDDDDDSSHPWDSHNPTPGPDTPEPESPVRPRMPTGPGGAGGAGVALGFNPLPTPNTATRSLPGGSSRLGGTPGGSTRAGPSSLAAMNRLRPPNEWRNGAAERGREASLQSARAETPHVPDDDEMEEDIRRAAEVNGDMNEEEAFRRAREASAASQTQGHGEVNGTRGLPGGVLPSIENRDNEDGETDSTMGNA
ncbi:hypothetical protein LTR53_008972 [Teratosphaeriaceae sp. CCFEE 6253]|nr:hypothetical protein LTR53_008972 [Teratosphaeriaceae sp. CCFEE 6253]